MWPPSQLNLNHVFSFYVFIVCLWCMYLCCVRLFFISTKALHCMMLSMYDPEIWGRQRKTTCSTFGLWISSGKFSEKKSPVLWVDWRSLLSAVSRFTGAPDDPLLIRESSGALSTARLRNRGLLTVFHAQSLQGKNVRLVCLQNCIQTCREIDFLIH